MVVEKVPATFSLAIKSEPDISYGITASLTSDLHRDVNPTNTLVEGRMQDFCTKQPLILWNTGVPTLDRNDLSAGGIYRDDEVIDDVTALTSPKRSAYILHGPAANVRSEDIPAGCSEQDLQKQLHESHDSSYTSWSASNSDAELTAIAQHQLLAQHHYIVDAVKLGTVRHLS